MADISPIFLIFVGLNDLDLNYDSTNNQYKE